MSISSLNFTKGINTDSHYTNLGDDSFEYALNACVADFNGNEFSLQNDSSNILCSVIPQDKLVLGYKYILEQNRLLLFLASRPIYKTSPACNEEDVFEKTYSEIGEIQGFRFSDERFNIKTAQTCDTCLDIDYSEATPFELLPITPHCSYRKIVGSDCLNFNINFPIDVEYKIADCSLQIYFVDNFNDDRFLYFDFEGDLTIQDKFKVIESVEDCCIVYGDDLDCEKIKFNPNIIRPLITIDDLTNNGSLEAGSYEFLIAFSDSLGNEMSEYLFQTNPLPIFTRKLTDSVNYITNKSVSLSISNIDQLGVFRFYNLAVLITVGNFKKAQLIGTFPISQNKYTFTGSEAVQNISLDRVLARKVYYKKSKGLTKANNYLFRFGLEEYTKPNLQRIANMVKLYWQTTSLPEGIYENGVYAEKYRTYQRDEVYPFGIVFEYWNGDQSNILHIPNYSTDYYFDSYAIDLRVVITNNDAFEDDNECTESVNEKWKVYNSANVLSKPHEEYDPCTETVWEYGEFAYWESTEKYPTNTEIWGDLCGQPVRYHKFPDSAVTHIHDGINGSKVFNKRNNIYPIGVKVDHNSVKKALQSAVSQCWITQNDYDRIKSYRIVRGDRTGHKSVVAKGLIYNVNQYTKDGKTYSYPNYPYNDLREDKFLSANKDIYEVSNSVAPYLPFNLNTKKYTFHSPDIHFASAASATYLKLETEEYGQSEGWFDYCRQQAEYKFLTTSSAEYYIVLARLAAGGLLTIGSSSMEKHTDFLVAMGVYRDLILSYTPYINYALQYNSVGVYNNFFPVANSGNKLRKLDFYGFLNPSVESLRIGNTSEIFNNWHRESSAVLQIAGTILPSPTRVDNSRYLLSESEKARFYFFSPFTKSREFADIKDTKQISSYYASVKNEIPAQYGRVGGVKYLEVGKGSYYLDKTYVGTIFGGDTFINRFGHKRKHPFFKQTSFKMPNQTDIKYSEQTNVGYPRYYFDTNPYGQAHQNIVLPDLSGHRTWSFWKGGYYIDYDGVSKNFFDNSISIQRNINVPTYRLDFDTTPDTARPLAKKGFIYLYSYGVPYYICESDVNVDLRHGHNTKEGDFYPRVSDVGEWLQEDVVPISEDNTYYYNGDYSINKFQTNAFFNSLIFKPNKVCKVVYPNRVIYSDQTTEISNSDGLDRWLLHKASNSHDFSLSDGELVSVEGIENDKILCRLENNTKQYNAYSTLATDAGLVQIDNGGIFASKPQEFVSTDLGYFGTQHKAILKTEFGTVTVDAKRGNIFLMSGGLDEISKNGAFHWFKENLPFTIEEYFPEVNTDNNFAGIGLALCYDKRFRRFFLTKLDYKPIHPDLKYDSLKKYFYVEEESGRNVIFLNNSKYFCNKSWTRSFSFVSKTWTSFHSFLPNYYIDFVDKFSSGLNAVNSGNSSLWLHNITNKSFQVFYGKLHPFIIETNAKYDGSNKAILSVDFSVDVRRYHNERDYAFINDKTYNKAIISNQNQTSGVLNLNIADKNNVAEREKYPIKGLTSHDIEVLKRNNYIWSFNQFKDVTKSHYLNQPLWLWNCANSVKYLNLDLLNYQKRENILIRKDDLKVTLINDKLSNYKFIHKFTNFNQVQV